ncbi:MAG: hypothetical protein P1P65_05925 [Treponema sp.]
MYESLRSGKRIWIGHCLLLYGPFFIEAIYSLIIKHFEEPSAYWFFGMYFLLCYLFYGAVCAIHITWRKKIGETVIFRYVPNGIVWIAISVFIGIAGSKMGQIMLYGYVFSPMIVRDVYAYFIRFSPRAIGAVGFTLQYIYYCFEFTLITVLVDCIQKTSEKYALCQKIPWGGLFLALTWGIGHAITKNNIQDGLYSALMSLPIGIVYLLPENKRLNTWCAAAAIYFL